MDEMTYDPCEPFYMTEEELQEGMRESVRINPQNATLEATYFGTFPPEWVLDNIDKDSMSTELAWLTGVKWLDGYRLRIRLMDGDPVIRKKVETYMKDWDPFINLRMVFTNDTDAEIRVQILGGEPQSAVGTLALGRKDYTKPTMWLGLTPTSSDVLIRRRAHHEFGHALGCIHEHQSPVFPYEWDEAKLKAKVTADFKSSTPPRPLPADLDGFLKTNYLTKYDHTSSNSSEYDPLSVMLYSIDPALLKKPFPGSTPPTPLPTAVTPLYPDLSAKDKDFIRRMYPKKLTAAFTIGGKMGGWLDTGVKLYAGQQVRITATGKISFGPFGSWPFTPAGEAGKIAERGAPAPGLLKNSLVAVVGGGVIYIGDSKLITSQYDGPLLVAQNDNFAPDNDGAWNLVIEVFHK